MTNEKTTDKYDELYASAVEFAFRIHLCNREEVEGATDAEIQQFCNKHNVILPPAMWSYTRHFGRKARIRDTDYNCVHSLTDYQYALDHANRREEWNEMLNLKELLSQKNFKVNYDEDSPEDNEGLYTPEITSLVDVNNVLPFHYDEFTRTFKFLDSSLENPIIYYLTRYYALSSTFTSFTNRYRDVKFMYIVNSAPQGFAEMGLVNGKRVPISPPPVIDYSDGFEYLKVYQELFKKKDLDRGRLKQLREAFYMINDEIEEKENRILSFTEFENNFIRYITENRLYY